MPADRPRKSAGRPDVAPARPKPDYAQVADVYLKRILKRKPSAKEQADQAKVFRQLGPDFTLIIDGALTSEADADDRANLAEVLRQKSHRQGVRELDLDRTADVTARDSPLKDTVHKIRDFERKHPPGWGAAICTTLIPLLLASGASPPSSSTEHATPADRSSQVGEASILKPSIPAESLVTSAIFSAPEVPPGLPPAQALFDTSIYARADLDSVDVSLLNVLKQFNESSSGHQPQASIDEIVLGGYAQVFLEELTAEPFDSLPGLHSLPGPERDVVAQTLLESQLAAVQAVDKAVEKLLGMKLSLDDDTGASSS
jgi:hypothetical protein